MKRGRVTVTLINEETGELNEKEVSIEEGDTVGSLKRKVGADDDSQMYLQLEKRRYDTNLLNRMIDNGGGIGSISINGIIVRYRVSGGREDPFAMTMDDYDTFEKIAGHGEMVSVDGDGTVQHHTVTRLMSEIN